MRPVHLRMMELERDCQCPFPQMPPVFSPNQKGVVEYSAVHPYRPVYFVLCKGGCPDDHAVRQVMIAATFGHLFCEPQVIGVELPQVRGERNVAGAYFTFLVGDYGIDGNMVVLYQFPADRQHVEFLDAACSLSDTPAHKHVEFQSFPLACPDKAGHVHCLEKSEHRHGCVHPHFKCVGAGGFLGVYFFHMVGEYVESGVWSN